MKIFCILSDERAFRSKSPALYNAIFKKIGISAAYVPLKVLPDQLGAAMQSLKTLNFSGANITIPYKSLVIPYMNIMSEGANIIGAVNTIIRNGDELKGYNTNAIGFMDTLEEAQFDVTGKKALIFGSGGGARAVIFILNWLRADAINIAGRTESRVNDIISRIGGTPTTLEFLDKNSSQAEIIVNTTPISSPEDSLPFHEFIQRQPFKSCRLIIDLNYGRKNNFWKEKAKSLDIPFIDGLIPLAHTARRTLILWTRVDIPPPEFMKALREI
ncbi:shikimate dehydrogenase family protein [Desulfocicer niacini]